MSRSSHLVPAAVSFMLKATPPLQSETGAVVVVVVVVVARADVQTGHESLQICKKQKNKNMKLWWKKNNCKHSSRDPTPTGVCETKTPERCYEQDRCSPSTVKFSEPRWLRT